MDPEKSWTRQAYGTNKNWGLEGILNIEKYGTSRN
jgi:hypothetical protein